MNTDELAALAMAAVLEGLGDAATYLPRVGAVRPASVFLRRPERVIDGLGVTRLSNEGQIVEIERAALAVDPQPGDQLRVQGKLLTVKSARPAGASAAIWELSCEPA